MIVARILVDVDDGQQNWGEYRLHSLPFEGGWLALRRGDAVHDLTVSSITRREPIRASGWKGLFRLFDDCGLDIRAVSHFIR